MFQILPLNYHRTKSENRLCNTKESIMPKERNSRKSTGRRKKSNSYKGRPCFNCHKEGHWASKCPSKIKSSTDISDDESADDPQVIKSRRDLIPETKSTQTNTGMNTMNNYNPKLAEFLGKKMATHAQAFKIVLDYVKEHKLQDPKDKTIILPDEKMSEIFGKKRISTGGIHRQIAASKCCIARNSSLLCEDCKNLP